MLIPLLAYRESWNAAILLMGHPTATVSQRSVLPSAEAVELTDERLMMLKM